MANDSAERRSNPQLRYQSTLQASDSLSRVQALPGRFPRSSVQPVSRVWFELTDSDAFDRCIALTVDWMGQIPKSSSHPRSGVELPDTAVRGETFDITDELGANPTKAIRLKGSDGDLWAARLDWPDPVAPRTWLSEFFVEKKVGQLARFGAQLTCVHRAASAAFDTTRQRVVGHVLEQLSAEADGRCLSDKIDAAEVHEVDEIVDLLYDERRRLPVVVVSESDNSDTVLLIKSLAQRVAGAAHIIHLTREASWELTRSIGKHMSVFGGAVRLYHPGLAEVNEDPFDHPLWLKPDQEEKSALGQIANRVLSAGFLIPNDTLFPRYATVRDASARLTLKARNASIANLDQEELTIARRSISELTEERDVWISLAQEEQSQRHEAEREVERLKSEISRLEQKNKSLQFLIENKVDTPEIIKSDRELKSYDDLEDWAEETLGESVHIHHAALKDCRKNGSANMLKRIESALLIMRDYMTPARREGNLAKKDTARQKLAAIGFEDSACFADRDEAQRRPQYSVMFDGRKHILFDHLKFGNGYNNTSQIRIYYFWDTEKSRYVVGKMPSHLPNNLTN